MFLHKYVEPIYLKQAFKALVSAAQSARSICLSASGAQKFKIEREREHTLNIC